MKNEKSALRTIARTAASVMIVLIAIAVYFYRFRSVPTGYHLDSLSDLVNAMCLRLTGADEYGTLLPWYLRSMDDNHPPIMVYLFSLLGLAAPLSLFTARVFCMTLGISALAVTFWYVRWAGITKKRHLPLAYPLIFSFLLLSSWILVPHRIPIEWAGNCFFMALLIPVGWELIKRPGSVWLGVLHGLAVSVMLYLDYGTKTLYFLSLPVPLFFLWLRGFRFSARAAKGVIISLVLALLLGIPTFKDLLGPKKTLQRFNVVKATEPVGVLSRYVTHMLPTFLFIEADHNRRHATSFGGELNAFFFPAYVAGLVALFAAVRRRDYFWLYILAYWLFGFFPVSLTNEGIPHSIRTLMAVAPVTYVLLLGYERIEAWVISGPGFGSGSGARSSLTSISNRGLSPSLKRAGLCLLFVFGIYQAYMNVHAYFEVDMQTDRANWQYFEGEFVPPAIKVPYDDHRGSTLGERYYRLFDEHDARYCDRILNPKPFFAPRR